MSIYIPPQIKHLLPALLVFILLFLIGRHLIIPDTFGELGHYRAASLLDNEARDMQYAGHEACAECHAEVAENKEYDLHSEITCETCHGPGLAHVNDPVNAKLITKQGRDFCGLCHALIPARSKDMVSQVNIATHHTERKICIDCHNPHQPWELKE